MICLFNAGAVRGHVAGLATIEESHYDKSKNFVLLIIKNHIYTPIAKQKLYAEKESSRTICSKLHALEDLNALKETKFIQQLEALSPSPELAIQSNLSTLALRTSKHQT